MERQRIEELRSRVPCSMLLVELGFLLDRHESSRRALKFRRGGEIIIVTHEGAGWFDPLSDEKGDVFALASLFDKVPFIVSVERVARLAGADMPPPLHRKISGRSLATVSTRWSIRPRLTAHSPAGRYLQDARALPSALLWFAGRADLIRQGPHGSAWFRHQDEFGRLTGWEERGAHWRGFSSGGAKSLFRLGRPTSPRICVTEAAIDALSLAAIEEARGDTLYASTGGGWSPSTVRAIEAIAPRGLLVAATDADPQGEVYADRLRQIAAMLGSDFMRLRPRSVDWNEDLKEGR